MSKKKEEKKSFSSCSRVGVEARWDSVDVQMAFVSFRAWAMFRLECRIEHHFNEFVRKRLLQMERKSSEKTKAKFWNLAAQAQLCIETQIFIYFFWWWNCFDVCAFVSFCFQFFCVFLFYAFKSTSISGLNDRKIVVTRNERTILQFAAAIFCRSNINIVISLSIR